jgi:hypothetical protein
LIKVSAIALRFHVVAMDEAERRRIDAIAKTAFVSGTIRKNVTEMAVAVR